MRGLRGSLSLPWQRMATATFFVGTLLYLVSAFVAGPFGYLGYISKDVSATQLVTGASCTLILAATVRGTWTRPSDCAYGFLVAVVALPALWIPAFYGPLEASLVVQLQLIVLGAFIATRIALAGGRRTLRPLVLPKHLFWGAFLAALLVAFVYLVVRVGFRLEAVGFDDVAEQRDVYTANVGRAGAYLMGWVGAGTLPAVIAVGLHRRSLATVSAGAAGILVLYSLTGFKSYLVGLALVATAYAMARQHRLKVLDWMLVFGVVMWLAALVDRVSGTIWFTSLLVRRAISTSGLNTAFYMEFFSRSPAYELRHSVLAFLGAPPYAIPPARIIGLEYYGSLDTAANANFVADGIANFGIPGALAAGLLLGLILRFYDSLTGALPITVTAPALMFVLVALANTALLTVLLTHGGIVIAVVMWLFAGQFSDTAQRAQPRAAMSKNRRSSA